MDRSSFVVTIPGSTSNLGAGFDTASAALSIYLSLTVEPGSDDGITWPADWTLPREENMIEQAYLAACSHLGIPASGLSIGVSNEIPFKRGLGSSGAAIIGGIRIAEHLAGVTLTPQEVFQIAYPLERHPDNLSASFLGGWVISRVGDGSMEAERIESSVNCRFVVAIPEVVVSTAEARRILPTSYSLSDAVFNVQRSALLVHALHTGRKDLLKEATQDRLHQSYRARLVPGLTELLARTALPPELSEELVSITVSGSGSTVLALADGKYEEIGDWMRQSLERAGTSCEIRVLDLDRVGARVSVP
ncbi:MAG: homoserine kinase [Acidobacteriota bacterium]|nr:MAG: homoserine kinase [Acidobacteriota bacterium]